MADQDEQLREYELEGYFSVEREPAIRRVLAAECIRLRAVLCKVRKMCAFALNQNAICNCPTHE